MFHLDQLDPDDKAGLWARSGDATTTTVPSSAPARAGQRYARGGPEVHRPAPRPGDRTAAASESPAEGLALVDAPRYCRAGKEGLPTMATSSVQEAYTTGENGLFPVFRRLWPEDRYDVVVEARGHKNGESSRVTGKLGETHDVGKIVLINTNAVLEPAARRGLRRTSDRWGGSV